LEFEWIKVSCLEPAKDAAWPPAGYGPNLIGDNSQNKVQEASTGTGRDTENNRQGISSKSSIVVPIALTGGLFGGMVVIGYALSVLARKKRAAKVNPAAGKPEMSSQLLETP
jgi:hypothetical protein